ncbi:UNVERIFIED_CONTAM: hypothetical protein Slati_1732500 [Sesamum latifolium]|uniref:Uncharacterized protein n=1 Tax=Sesamum latifolium TaxID=2727402 RepID=A0AAW2WXK3_9LAMI
MKTYADKKRTKREFQVGDEVFLRLQPYRQTTVALRRQLKLLAKHFGPYKGTIEIGDVELKRGAHDGVLSGLGQSEETRDFVDNDRALGMKAQPTGGHASSAGEFVGGRNFVS